MLLEKLIEQHRVDRAVSHTLNLPVSIADCQVGIDLSHVLSDEAVVKALAFVDVLLVSESDWLKCKQRLACVVHWFDFFLVTSGWTAVAKQACVQVHGHRIGTT